MNLLVTNRPCRTEGSPIEQSAVCNGQATYPVTEGACHVQSVGCIDHVSSCLDCHPKTPSFIDPLI